MNKITEKSHPKSTNIDRFSTKKILSLINSEDKYISDEIKKNIPIITELVNQIVTRLYNKGKLFYVGCGTSGRLGVLDASECPPTFGTNLNLIKGIIAGGNKALFQSIEGAEDSKNEGKKIIKKMKIGPNDIVIGISASSVAKYVLGSLEMSKKMGALTALITFNKIKENKQIDYIISTIVGPEIISGSTRMKAGTATKMILNMISTTTMIKMNKVYKNFMVDLKISNSKLLDRGIRIVSKLTCRNYKDSSKLLNKANGNVKVAIIMDQLEFTYNKSIKILKSNKGNLRKILDKRGI